MKTQYPLITATVSTAIINVAAHPMAVATDRCTAPSETICAPEPPAPTDSLEHQPSLVTIERTRGEQAPPPAPHEMPPSRGMTYAMQDPDPYWLHDAAIRGSVASQRNTALLMPGFRGFQP